MGCSTAKHSTGGTQAFDLQGHRGCRGFLPENSIPAMLKALDLGVTTLEMDVVYTGDRQIILSHEPFFNHEITTGPDGKYIEESAERSLNIYKMTYAEVKTYDVGLKPHPRFRAQKKIAAVKPLLSDMIDSVRDYVASHPGQKFPFLNIETKTQPLTDGIYHPAPPAFVDGLMTVLKEKQVESFVIIQSFDIRTLQYLHQHYPAIRTALLIEEGEKRGLEEQLAELGFVPSIYSPHYSLIAKELVAACHAKKMKVVPWTVNSFVLIGQLKALGIDGVITDYPGNLDH